MPVVLITGASSGIGAALAEVYAARGFDLLVLARRTERLQRLSETLQARYRRNVLGLACDVTDATSIEQSVAQGLGRFGHIDCVIANAGIGRGGAFEQLSVEDFRRVFETNFFGVLSTLRVCLPALKKSGGRIGVIGSVNSYFSMPRSTPYCASKAALRGFCDSLRPELSALGISLTLICPGLVESEIRGAADPAPAWLVMPAPQAARKIAAAVESRRAEVVITLHGKALVFLQRHAPWLVRAALRSPETTPRK